jgi:hypothetical protein
MFRPSLPLLIRPHRWTPFSNEWLNFKHLFWAIKGLEKGIFAAFAAQLGKLAGWLQSCHNPAADHFRQPVDRRFIKRKLDRRLGKLFTIAQEHAGLAKKPNGCHHQRAVVGFR